MKEQAPFKPTVFISYARGEDKYCSSFAELFCQGLEKTGLQTKLDVRDISYADPWQDVVKNTIDNPKSICLTFLSPQYVFSKSTIYEKDLAENIFHALGKPIIPILLKEFRDYRDFIGHHVAADFRDLFDEYCRKKGKNLSDHWRKCFEDEINKVAKSIETQFNNYYNNLNVFRIDNPNNPFLEKSKTIYELYPKDYSEPHGKIVRWLYETYKNNPRDYFNEEIYIIASYRGEIIGVIYATLYTNILAYPSYCHINMMATDPKFEYSEISSPLSEKHPIVPAEALLSKLKKVVEQYDSACDRYIFELPDPKKSDNPKTVEGCWKSWLTIRPDYEDFKLMKCTNIVFRLPNQDWTNYFSPEDAEGETEDAVLLFLIKPGMRQVINKKKMNEHLKFIYMVYYGECYYHPYSLKPWVDYLTKLYDEVIRSIKDTKFYLEEIHDSENIFKTKTRKK